MIINKIKFNPSTRPGVYLFRNRENTVIYVGKARNLRQRLSYYREPSGLDAKSQSLISRIAKVSWMETVSEPDALVLEADLIKKYKPRFNRLLKDDKNYQLVGISVEKDPQNTLIGKFPKVSLVREKKEKNAVYFGPYPVGSSIRAVLSHLRKIHKFRDCSRGKFQRFQKLNHGCFYFDLNLCSAPCTGLISPQAYRREIKSLKKFLSGDSLKIERDLRSEMKRLSSKLDFEKADQIKRKIQIIQKIWQIKFSPSDYVENPSLVTSVRETEIKDLVDFINTYSHPGVSYQKEFKIEAYDVSHLGGGQATASMVVFVDGEPRKDLYKRFKIKKVKGINDYLMLKEVIDRRKNHPEWMWPQLILVDGGISQVNAVVEALEKSAPLVIGLAKRLERPVVGGEYRSLSGQKPALNLLRRIRDESHRFAKAYHLLLRLKSLRAK